MFRNINTLPSRSSRPRVDPKDIPPPTPVTLPRYQPFTQDDAVFDLADALPTLLKHTGRGNHILGAQAFSSIGLDLSLDATAAELIPDPAYIPDFSRWGQLTADEAGEENQSTRRLLSTGNLSPGCQVYLERKKELSNSNEDGFRTVRRIPPPKGKQQARLGNTYEFFRCLELFTPYWDDPTRPPSMPPSPELTPAEVSEASEESQPEKTARLQEEAATVIRTAAGTSMPAEYRQNLITALTKLVAYDFGCNISSSRVEPRLQLRTPAGTRDPRKSYWPSGCGFIFKSPSTREAARAGLVYGPVAAVSARPTISFDMPDVEAAQSMDLAREVVAALITAQHRAREGEIETRFGEGQWWASKPRWGGGPGGPIGREIEKDAVVGDKDAKPGEEDMPAAKKPRKNMSLYDNYRMVRQPASTWDKKARYEAIGKQKGAKHDDIFVVSCLFHHVSVLRVRVPKRLLEVLDGSPEPEPSRRSWGKVQAWRSPWYDVFRTEERVAAMELLWSMMAYQMRSDAGDGVEDVNMTDA